MLTVCIIAPVSSWAVAVGGYMGEDGFNTFVASIPYNFYALLTIFFVFFMLFLQKDFGPMAAAQAEAEGRIPAEGAAIEAVSLARIDDKGQGEVEDVTRRMVKLEVPAWREPLPAAVAAAGEGAAEVPAFAPLYAVYAPVKREPATATLIPYFAWANRGENEMTVWLRG